MPEDGVVLLREDETGRFGLYYPEDERVVTYDGAIKVEFQGPGILYGWGEADGQDLRESIESDIAEVSEDIETLREEDLTPGQAWAAYGVHVAGHSRNAWATRCGYSDHSAVSEPLRKAEERAGHLGLLDE